MEHSPPPFFNRGPAPLVRLAFFASLSLALLVLDARFRYTESVRSVLALAVYPLQILATMPAALGERLSGYFASQTQLRDENAELSLPVSRQLGDQITEAGGEVVAGDCHLANTAITEQTGRVPVHPLQVVARAYGIPEEG